MQRAGGDSGSLGDLHGGPVGVGVLGPVLFLDDIRDGQVWLSALVLTRDDGDLAPLICDDGAVHPFRELACEAGWRVMRARFRGEARSTIRYSALGTTYELAGAFGGNLNIAFASCNGEEHGDLDRDPEERNVMWARLLREHKVRPFHLLLHGGDQIYADEVTQGHPLSEDWPDHLPKDPSREGLEDLRAHLRRGFFERYVSFFLGCPDMLALAATVPSLCQWDDHDICDGWGSLRRSRTYSPIGQTLFDVARETALLFQHACVDGDLPGRFHDPEGLSLSWRIDLPDLRIVAPDLRSERTRRQVMGRIGWEMMDDLLNATPTRRLIVVSSVPLLGPRLSILEAVMVAIPQMQKYEDDLRDQWQSRAHRSEWRRMLELLRGISELGQTDITIVSGEIHLATRGTMPLGQGRVLHQLIASGVAHRAPPNAWARVLGWLAVLGDSPLSGAPIRMQRLPGQRRRYVAERNTLTLRRVDGEWGAIWDLEQSGQTAPLPV